MRLGRVPGLVPKLLTEPRVGDHRLGTKLHGDADAGEADEEAGVDRNLQWRCFPQVSETGSATVEKASPSYADAVGDQ